jgi:hypothetical protein
MAVFQDVLMISNLEPQPTGFETDYGKAEYLQEILINRATQDGPSNDEHYKELRKYFLEKSDTRQFIPTWISTNRDLDQYWHFIKRRFATYRERREFIWNEFRPLLDHLEHTTEIPLSEDIRKGLVSLDSDYVVGIWRKALERKTVDLDGAITAARSLLEAILKHILDESRVEYCKSAGLHDLYKSVSDVLNLTPERHEEVVFKKILGGCSSVVTGLGGLRNRIGDAHGQGRKQHRANPRHAELAVNMAGTMCLFIVQTYQWRKSLEEIPQD